LDAQKELVDPAIQGTLNVLQSAEKHRQTVRRCVVTGSIAAVLNYNDLGTRITDPNTIFSENDWNLTSNLTDGPYRYGKRLSEEMAWKWSCRCNMELVMILPTMVLGKLHSSSKTVPNFSNGNIAKLMSGEAKKIPKGGVAIVSVQDVATAHILAFEVKEAAGQRYICNSETYSWESICKVLRENFPNYPIPTELDLEYPWDVTCGFLPKINNSKICNELNLIFRSAKQCLKEAAECLIEYKYLS